MSIEREGLVEAAKVIADGLDNVAVALDRVAAALEDRTPATVEIRRELSEAEADRAAEEIVRGVGRAVGRMAAQENPTR